MKAARLCRAALLAVGPYLVVGCSGSHSAPSEPPPNAPSGKPSHERPPEARPVFSNCLLGNSRFTSAGYRESLGGTRRPDTPSEPSCIIGANCIAQQGVTTPGDGAVSMKCESGQCSCHLEALAPPPTVVDFQFTATCSTPEVMRRLIRDHCLVGMDVKERAHLPDEPPR